MYLVLGSVESETGKILERQGAEVVLYDGNKKLMEEKVRRAVWCRQQRKDHNR